MIELNGNTYKEFLLNVKEIYLKLQEDLECIEEHFKEFLINALQENN